MGLFNLFSSSKKTQRQSQQSEAQLQLDMFDNLSQTQKFAMVAMLASLAAAPTNAERTAMVQKMMMTDAAMMGITENMFLDYMQTHTKPTHQTVMSTLKTITDTMIKEWLIYSGFSICAVNQNEKALYIFFDWWQQLGYNHEEIECGIKKMDAICKEFNNI